MGRFVNKPVITAVIPTFKRVRLLERAIESVLLQTYQNLKICIYDNSPDDETKRVVERYLNKDARVLYKKNPRNIGAINNIVQGVKLVDTEYYSLLSDDDFLLPNFYERVIQAFEKYPDAGFVCAKTITIDLNSKSVRYQNENWQHGYYRPSKEIVSRMFYSHFTQTGVVLRKDMRQLIGSFDPAGDDKQYMTLASASCPFVVIDGFGAVYMIHKDSFSALLNYARVDVSSLHKSMLASVKIISQLKIEDDTKAILLRLFVSNFEYKFEAKKAAMYVEGKLDPENDLVSSRVTFAGLLCKLYEHFSDGVATAFTKMLKGFRRAIADKSKSSVQRSVALPSDLFDLFSQETTDVKKILSRLDTAPRNRKTGDGQQSILPVQDVHS